MANTFLLAAPIAILPAMVTLWVLLKRYEDYFDDARVFISLTIGLFAGLVITALEILAFPFAGPQFIAEAGEGTAFALFVGGYAFLESAAKTVVLGSSGYRTRKDTPYYGAALGLGLGAMSALYFISQSLERARQNDNEYTALPFVTMAMVFVGAVLVHGAAGVWIGKGAADGKLWRGLTIGALLQMPLLGATWLFWPTIGQGNVVVVFPAVFSVGYGVALLAITSKRVLDHVVPPEIRDQVRRERRRAARQQGRGGA